MSDQSLDRTGWVTEPLAAYPAEPPFPSLTDFERKVLEGLAETLGPRAAEFLAQVETVRVIDRINTKVGFYTRVSVDRGRSRPLDLRGKGATFEVEGLKAGIGIILWEDDGYLETIEGYTCEGDAPLEGVELASIRHVRRID